jgi:hypothetical protein
MKFVRFAFAGFVVCMLALMCDAQVLKRTTTKSDTIPLGAGSTLSIVGAPVGSIKVSVVPGNEVHVAAEIEVQAANEADLSGAALLTTYVTQETLGKLAIVSVGADSRRKFTNEEKKLIKRLSGMPYRIDYTIGVPRYTNIEIDGGKGDLEISHVQGYVRVNFAESNAILELEGGETDITIGHGKLQLQLGLANGGIRNSTVQMVAGDIALTFPVRSSADIDAAVLRTGRIENLVPDLKPRDRKTAFTQRLVSGKKGVGGVAVKVTVGDGNITLDIPRFQ